MQGISLREFARRDGCSETLVRKALKRGALIAFDDGSVDPSLVGSPWRKTNANGSQSSVGGKVEEDRTELHSFAEAQRHKENYLARLRQLEFEVKSGQLVEADAVEREVFRQARMFRDALQAWPARVAPLIAAQLGVDQVALTIALEKHVREFLTERSDPDLHIKRRH